MNLGTLRRAAAAVGATVENDSVGNWICYQVVAPDGKRWVESDGHYLVVSCYTGNRNWVKDAIADALPRIASGLRDATPEELEDSDGV